MRFPKRDLRFDGPGRQPRGTQQDAPHNSQNNQTTLLKQACDDGDAVAMFNMVSLLTGC